MTSPHFFLGCSLALGLLGGSLLQFRTGTARKGALACFWLSTGGMAWALSGAAWAGLLTLALWIVFPLSEIVFVLRRLRIPRERLLDESSPPTDEFPELRPITHELQDLGFRKVEDCNLNPPVQEQFFRLFGHESGLHHGVIGFVSDHGVGFDFVAFSSEDRQGRQWTTWDYPMSYGLKVPPQLLLHRALHCETAAELFAEHLELLHLNGVADADLLPGSDAAAVRARLEGSLARQLHYNVKVGILSPREEREDGFRYSWRGTFFVASEVVRDLVRL